MPHPPLALVGAACRLPGGVVDLPSFTAHLRAGRDVIRPAPAWRGFDATYDPRPGALGRSCQIEGGWLDHLRDVDLAAFGLNPREATALDPQHRLLLE
ncbi:MAG: hypothetical protein KC621_20885, partial [Myxococcales bacterium]|nr:hypothetical protein [Myxococcales bacterium]